MRVQHPFLTHLKHLNEMVSCSNCTDYDLCESCEAKTTHDPSHVFIQIRTPLPDVYADLHAPLLSEKIYQVSLSKLQ